MATPTDKELLKQANKKNIRDKTEKQSVSRAAIADGIDGALDYTDKQVAGLRKEVNEKTPTGLATVATSGKYSDLKDAPAIPEAYTDEDAQKLIDVATAGLPIAWSPETATTSFFKVATVYDELLKQNVATSIDLFIDTIARAVFAKFSAKVDGATNKLTLTRGFDLPDILVTLPAGGGTSTDISMPDAYAALTDSNFSNYPASDGRYLTYLAPDPAYFLASQNDWDSGANAGHWALRLPAGARGGVRFKFVDITSSLAALGIRTSDTSDFRKSQIQAGAYLNNGKICYLVDGAEVSSAISAVTNEYAILYSDGTSLKLYRSVDGTARTQLVYTFANITPATQDLFIGQCGHFGSKLSQPAHLNFV